MTTGNHDPELFETTTDTATLVVFDPASLADKVNQECDWWTGEGDLDREEANRTLAFVDTGTDGIFRMHFRFRGDHRFSGKLLKKATIHVPSGELLFGAGECLPGEGDALREYLGVRRLHQGTYHIEIFELETSSGLTGEYGFYLVPVENWG